MLTVKQIIERDRRTNKHKLRGDSYFRDVFAPEIRKRLPTKELVLVCDDFRRMGLKFKCCETCHTSYSHFDMHVLALTQSISPDKNRRTRHAWVCDPVADLLVPRTPKEQRELDAISKMFHSLVKPK